MSTQILDFFNYLQQLKLIPSDLEKPDSLDLESIAKKSHLPKGILSFYENQYAHTEIIKPEKISKHIRKMVPDHICHRHKCVPISLDKEILSIAAENPYDEDMQDMIEQIYDGPIQYKITPSSQIFHLLHVYYHNVASEEFITDTGELKPFTPDLIDKLINKMIVHSYDAGASDIHLHWQDTDFYYKFRRHGEFQPEMQLPHQLATLVKNRILVRAGVAFNQLDIAQDCSIDIKHEPSFTVRISYIPTVDGYSLVMRLIRPILKLNLDQHMTQDQYHLMQQHLTKSQDLFIIYGPTSTGKTTVFYNLMQRLIDLKKKVITMEDPIEKAVQDAFQIDLALPGATYDKSIKQLLRQDPNAVMISEIRTESATKSLANAKMSGCLTISTIHATNPLECLVKLLKLGYPEHELFSQNITLLSTRLIPISCKVCTTTTKPAPAQKTYLQKHFPHIAHQSFKKSPGCLNCQFTGVTKITPFYYLLQLPRDELQQLIHSKDWQIEASKKLIEPMNHKVNTNLEDKLLAGTISLDVFIRMTQC